MHEDRPQSNASAAPEGPDVFFVSAPLDRSTAYRLYEAHKQSGRRKHCILVLTTSGGDADAAYLMARYLRRFYEKVTICVFGYCKSAGTLLALGAHEIVMGRAGRVGAAGCSGFHEGRNVPVQIRARDFRISGGAEGSRF